MDGSFIGSGRSEILNPCPPLLPTDSNSWQHRRCRQGSFPSADQLNVNCRKAFTQISSHLPFRLSFRRCTFV